VISMARKSTASKLSKSVNAKRNTKSGRAKMAGSSFALSKEKKYRIDDLPHARNALARVAQHGTPAQKKQVRAKVTAKFPSLKKSSGKKR
jgi:hypothetical protein